MLLPPLFPALLRARSKRFLAEVETPDGRVQIAHLPNPGRMTTALRSEGPTPCWCSSSDNPKRRLPWTVELTTLGPSLVLVNPQRANAIVSEALPRLFPEHPLRMAEARLGDRRMDFCVEGPAGRCWVEVKCVSLAHDGVAAFPDAVSARATHHLAALAGAVAAGDRAVLILLIGRSDATRFVPAEWIDPAWARALREAVAAGVEVWAFRAALSLAVITLGAPIPVDLSG